MKLEETTQSIVPGQSEIDAWTQMQRKKSEHAYQDKEIVFDAEKWIYERKSAYPMVDCIRGSAQGGWKKFNYHPVCKGIVLHDKDVITLGSDGTYSVKSKGESLLNADEAKYYTTYLEATRYAP